MSGLGLGGLDPQEKKQSLQVESRRDWLSGTFVSIGRLAYLEGGGRLGWTQACNNALKAVCMGPPWVWWDIMTESLRILHVTQANCGRHPAQSLICAPHRLEKLFFSFSFSQGCSHSFTSSWSQFEEYSTEKNGICDAAKGIKRKLDLRGLSGVNQ